MTRLGSILRLSAVLAALTATPAIAQDFDGSIGYGGGGIFFTDFNSGGDGSAFSLEPGWVANAHIERWINRGRLGARINVGFTQRPMETIGDTRNVSTWLVGGDLLLRLFSPDPARGFAPFLAAGVGMVSYGLGDGPSVVLPAEQAQYPGDTDRQFTVSGGLGFDILPDFTILGTPSGIRLEVIDHVALESPFSNLAGESFDPVHNIRVSLGLLGLVQIAR